jgi:carbon storage regulator
MLVLSRKVGEGVQIGDKIVVTIVRIAGGGVRIGIDAPADMAIAREELLRAPSAEGSPGQRTTEPALSSE